MGRLYANSTPSYMRDLSILRFWYPWGGPGTNSHQIPRDDCISEEEVDKKKVEIRLHDFSLGKHFYAQNKWYF